MKFLILSILFMISLKTFANTIANNSRVNMTYSTVRIFEIKAIENNIEYIPPTSKSMGKYRGTLDVTLLIEGNICSNDPNSIGTMFLRKGEKSFYIKLVSGEPFSTKEQFCKQFSAPRTVTFSLNVDSYENEDSLKSENLGSYIIKCEGQFAHHRGEKVIHISAENKNTKVVVTDMNESINQDSNPTQTQQLPQGLAN